MRRAAQGAEVAQRAVGPPARSRAGADRAPSSRSIPPQIEADRDGRAGARSRQEPGDRDRPAGAADRGPEQEPRGKPGQGRGRHGPRRGGRRRGTRHHRARDRDRRARQADRADRGGARRPSAQAIGVKVQAEAEKQAAADRAEAARAGGRRARPRRRSSAPTPPGSASRSRRPASARSTRQRTCSRPTQISLQTKLALLKVLPEVVREAAKPMEAIDSIKIVQVDGLTGARRGRRWREPAPANGNLASSAVAAALALPRAGADRRRADEGARLRRRDAGESRGRRPQVRRRADAGRRAGDHCGAVGDREERRVRR